MSLSVLNIHMSPCFFFLPLPVRLVSSVAPSILCSGTCLIEAQALQLFPQS